MTKWVYGFGDGKAEGRADMRALLGGKGANLAEMSNLGLPVPPGLTISTDVCTYYYAHGESYPASLQDEVAQHMRAIEDVTGMRFGDADNPLLVSVRSGAPVSMPGMMDTVLNLGLNDQTVEGLATRSADRRFAFDSYRRFIQMYGNVVMGVDHYLFEDALEDQKRERDCRFDTDLDAAALEDLVAIFKEIVASKTDTAFPEDPRAQLWGAIGAVFGSWQTPRAITYRRLHDIAAEMGTAVNVQAMVFGNMGADCATGVAFTRNPSTGEQAVYGEFLVNAQGEDVVAGIRTPQPLSVAMAAREGNPEESMERTLPGSYGELCSVFERLEQHYRDMQDIEFTIQGGKLYILQTRSGKRTTAAALKIAVDMAGDGLIDRNDAIRSIEPSSLDQLLHPTLDPKAKFDVLCKGLPASPGAVSGTIVFTADRAEQLAAAGEKVILVRVETSPDDIHGMHAAQGILTARGGMTSHAAVVARGMGKACVSGASALSIDQAKQSCEIGGRRFMAGEAITIDGTAGTVMAGIVPTVEPRLSGDFATLMSWADEVRRLGVRTNAETVLDAKAARQFGAEGIGLCRTEHMFFQEDRILAMREMILAENEVGRRQALAIILPMQRQDFIELFQIMKGLPVTIRLLDPPLHEFLPHGADEEDELAEALAIDVVRVRRRVLELREANPMLGLRGCRLGVLYPEISEMQARAILEAAAAVFDQTGETVIPEIMVPLIATARELEIIKERIDWVAGEVAKEVGRELRYLVGTMIELPRASLAAAKIAEHAEFFSFGTNDLTQMGLGLSRDDAGSFLDTYIKQGVFERDPFQTIDIGGVGELVRIGVERGRSVRPDIKLGICGEHGGDPASVRFCHEVGLDYVSCSPYRVPIARLAAAQAALGEG